MTVTLERSTRIVFAFALAAALAGCSSKNDPSPTSSSTVNVVITINGMNGNMSFSPANASVKVGQTVAWRNADSITHAIAQDSAGGFTTGSITAGATSAPVMISAAGTVPYHCTIHPTMTGSVTGM